MSKDRVLKAIKLQEVDRIPMMYRAVPTIHQKLLNYFGFDRIEKDWEKLKNTLGVDIFSSGSSLGEFTRYKPRYIGQKTSNSHDGNYFFVWGINGYYDQNNASMNYYRDYPLKNASTVEDIEKYDEPILDEFDFSSLEINEDLKNENFLCTGVTNSIFVLSWYIRGFENFLVDLVWNKKMAKTLVDKLGRFAFELNKKILQVIGRKIDSFSIWDDLAGQDGLLISKNQLEEFFLPWYKLFVQEAKKYDLIVLFHCCGSVHDLIPYLIDIGVDVLDPVQTSAREMDLETLKRRYGKNICLHGGIDVQYMLTQLSPFEIKEYVKNARRIYGNNGGIILGPSHRITHDTPLENALAIYNINSKRI
jgi:uroporphyrinogen decarboxylase